MIQTVQLTEISSSRIQVPSSKTIQPAQEVIQHDGFKIKVDPSQRFPFEENPAKFKFSIVAGWICWIVYLALEITWVTSLQSISTVTRLSLWTIIFAEVALGFVDISWAIDAIISISKSKKQGRRPHYQLIGDHVPHVDIFITTCGESLQVIMSTVKAAAAMEYPVSKFNVMVLDDGHDDALRNTIDKFNSTEKGFAKVHYRTRDGNSFFKAGNLNFGIQETKQLTGGEFLASLDADMIVSSDWLRNLVPHLLLDSEVALATSPQNYYSVPNGDPLAQQTEFSIWNTIFEPIHDYVGEAMCMGTGFVVRRKALESIGGWPLTATGEDYMCSTKLVEKGWKIALVRENHQHGITPESFQSRIKQRLRWVDAAFEVHSANNWYLTNNFGEGVTLLDKAASLIFALRDLSAVSTLLSLSVLPVAMLSLSSSAPIPAQTTIPYTTLNAALLVTFIVSKMCEWDVYHHIGMSHLSNLQALDIWASPYCAIRCLSHIFHTSSISTPSFFITGSFVCPTNERSKEKRAPLYKRLTTYGIPIHVVYTVLATTIIAYSLRMTQSTAHQTSSGTASTTISSLPMILPGHTLLLARCTWKMAVPVLYMIFPPTVPEWQDFLAPDDKGVLRPKKPFPLRAQPDQQGGLEMGHVWWWRDAFELLVLASALGGWSWVAL